MLIFHEQSDEDLKKSLEEDEKLISLNTELFEPHVLAKYRMSGRPMIVMLIFILRN